MEYKPNNLVIKEYITSNSEEPIIKTIVATTMSTPPTQLTSNTTHQTPKASN